MNITIPILDLFGALVICMMSMSAVYDGWRMVFQGKPILLLPFQIGLFLSRLFEGDEKANQRKLAQTSPNRTKRNGMYALLGGGMLLVAGLFYLIGIISMISIIP